MRQEDKCWAAFREQFPTASQGIYFNTSSHGLPSRAVHNALASYQSSWSFEAPWESTWHNETETCLAAFARLISAPATSVALMPSLTAAFQSVMYALDWSGRNEVVLSEREWVSLQHVVQAHPSAKAVFVPAQHAPDSDAFLQYIGKRTRLVAFSHVCYQTGYRSDIARTTNHAHEQGASCFVDAYQSLGVTEVDAMALNVDFLAAGALKFLLGIPGAAFLYVQLNQHESLQPTLAGWRGQTNPMNPALNPAEGARRFMGGTWPVPSVYGARAGLDLLLCTSVASTALRVEQLATHLHSALSSLNLEVLTPQEPARRAGIISVRCPNPAATLAALRELGVVCSLRGEGLRFSLHAYNTHREIDKAMSRLQRILATPNSDARFSPPLSET